MKFLNAIGFIAAALTVKDQYIGNVYAFWSKSVRYAYP